jgi:hypothetical protein
MSLFGTNKKFMSVKNKPMETKIYVDYASYGINWRYNRNVI